MNTPEYAFACLVCEEEDRGPKADLAARKHEEATGHSTTTHLVGGPFDQARKP